MRDSINLPDRYKLISLDTVGSTNDELKFRALSSSEEEGLVIWSLMQTAGKGRNKRVWVSDIGNMYVSVLFRPNCNMFDAAQIGFLPIIAAKETLQQLVGRPMNMSYKWPNDLLLNKKKVGGTLLEAGFDQETQMVWVIVGFGLNIKHFPSATFFPATSIQDEMGLNLKIEKVVELYLNNLSKLYSRWQKNGFDPVRKKWQSYGHAPNDTLRIRLGNEEIVGSFRDLDEKGALIVETNDGLRHIAAGDVHLMPTRG
jgi:BirA family biotin operon repressor/biotin-[acetyl-CoA-carboxylase] ligase